MFRRLLGLIILLATSVVLIILFAAAYYFGPALERISNGVDNGLVLTVETLETVSATLAQTQAVLVSINASLDTASQTTANLSKTVSDTVPLLDQVAVVVSDQLPENIEAIQAAIPNIAAVADVVDETLTRLAAFEINQTIPIPFNPIEIQYDLGIDYDPEVPFGDSMEQLGASLEGLPEELRALRAELEISAANLQTLSEDLNTASADLEAINGELAMFIPLLDRYLGLVDQVVEAVERTRTQLAANLQTIRMVGTILILALGLTQLAPLVVGWDLLTARNEPKENDKEQMVEQDDFVDAQQASQIQQMDDEKARDTDTKDAGDEEAA
jgi:hypothetical protein